jgi:hypothetical protein
MSCLVFAGPSRPERRILSDFADIRFLPPAGSADLVSAVTRYRPATIVLADDCSGRSSAVWHSEILWVLSQGIRVIGTAAGAIRAYELEDWGMQGRGEVFRLFKEGYLEDDDEVLALFQEEAGGGCRYLTEPLVNLRATLARAREQGVLTAAEEEASVAAIKEMFWRERSLENVFARLGAVLLPPERCEGLQKFFHERYHDLLRDDLRQTLRELCRESAKDLPRAPKSGFAVNANNPFWALYERDRWVGEADENIRLNDLAAYVLLNHPHSRELREAALNREIGLFLADYVGVTVSSEEVSRERTRFMTRHSLADEAALSVWIAKNDLCEEEFAVLLREQALQRRMQRWFLSQKYLKRLTRTILDELRLRGEYETWKERGQEREKLVREHRDELDDLCRKTSFEALLGWKMTHERPEWREDPKGEMEACGFTVQALFYQLAKDFLVKSHLAARAAALFGEPDA